MIDAPALDVEERLAVVVGQLNVLHAQLVELVVEARVSNVWAGVGIRSLTHWLTWKAGIDNRHAAQLVRLADARTTHPAISAEFDAGHLSVDQAATAVKVPAHCDTQVAAMAPLATVNQLRTIVRCAVPVTPPPGEQPADAVSGWFSDDGRYHLRADLAADRGRVVDAALAAARDRLRRDHARPHWVDALVDVCERSLDAEDRPRRERFRVNMYLDPTATVAARWPDGTPVPAAIREHLTCDATLSPVFTAGARPVSVGRTQRTPPERTRRLVIARDHGCRVPWCGARRHLDVHHLDHWAHGGHTDYDRLVTLCSRCHRAHHHGELGITGDPLTTDGLTFTDRHGHPITGQPRTVPPAEPPPQPEHPYQHPLGERLSTRDLAAALPDPPQHAPPTTDAA